jgi:hypothetical protein
MVSFFHRENHISCTLAGVTMRRPRVGTYWAGPFRSVHHSSFHVRCNARSFFGFLSDIFWFFGSGSFSSIFFAFSVSLLFEHFNFNNF